MAAILMDVLEKRGVAPAKFTGNFGLDGFAGLAANGRLTADIQTGLARMADISRRIRVARDLPQTPAPSMCAA